MAEHNGNLCNRCLHVQQISDYVCEEFSGIKGQLFGMLRMIVRSLIVLEFLYTWKVIEILNTIQQTSRGDRLTIGCTA